MCVQMKEEKKEQLRKAPWCNRAVAVSHHSQQQGGCQVQLQAQQHGLPKQLLTFLLFSSSCLCEPQCGPTVLTQAVLCWKADFLLDTKRLACPSAEAQRSLFAQMQLENQRHLQIFVVLVSMEEMAEENIELKRQEHALALM